jgi:hypothetical protein
MKISLQTATPGGRFTGGLMDLALNNPVDFGLAGSIGRVHKVVHT